MNFVSSHREPVKPSASAWVSQASRKTRARGEDVIVSKGNKQVLFKAMMATLEQDDDVLMCASYFGQYKDIVLFLGARTQDGETLSDDAEVTAYILTDAGVAAVPGSAYELLPFCRISTAASMGGLNHPMDRIAASVGNLKRKT